MKTKLMFVKLSAALLASFFGISASAQSVSIKKVNAEYTVEATMAPGTQSNIQASHDMRLWIDIERDLDGGHTYSFAPGGVPQRYFRLAPTVEAPPIRVMIIGDSMSADCCGWGVAMPSYFKPNATVINYASPWTSTKVFLQSSEMEKMLLVKPNYVFMQFAWTDGSVGDVDRMTTMEEFEANLRTLIDTVRGFTGVPMLVTLQAARTWDNTGKLISSDHPRNAITRRLAAELNVPLFDVYKMTHDLFTELGPVGAQFFHWTPGGPDDVMHISPAGARWVSRLVALQFPEALGPYLTPMYDLPPTQ